MAAFLLAVVGCGGSAPSKSSVAAGEPRQEVQAVLRERALALARGDVDGYLRPLAPEARAAEEPIARGAAAVPLATLELVLGEAELAGAGARPAQVDLVFQYRGTPEDNQFRSRLHYELERRDGAWVVTTSRPDPDLPLPMWAAGPVATAESAHFLALFRPGLDDAPGVLALMERARAELAPRLTFEPDPRHVVLLARDGDELADLTGQRAAGAVVALAEYVFRQTAGHLLRPESRQMAVDVRRVLDPGIGLVRYAHEDAEATARQVMQHELAHLALSRATRPTTPGWVVEGAAVFVSGERRVEWSLGLSRTGLDRLSFMSLSRRENLSTTREYAYAGAAVHHLVEAFGAAAFWEFYRNFKDMPAGADLEEGLSEGTRRLLRRHYQIDEAELDRRTRQWIVGAGGP